MFIVSFSTFYTSFFQSECKGNKLFNSSKYFAHEIDLVWAHFLHGCYLKFL